MAGGDALTWGVLGTGTVARLAMIPALSRLATGRVVAVASASQERADALAAQCAIPRAYGSYEALIADPDIAAVYIALPNHLHHEWTLRALAAGKHVLCEKPLAMQVAQLDEMIAAAHHAKKLLMEAMMFRFHPRTERLRELLATGEIGEVEAVQASFCFTLSDLTNYRQLPESGGGALLDVGGYCVAATCLAFPAEPLAVDATARYSATRIDESVSVQLAYEGDRTAQITCSFRAAEDQRITVIGKTAVLEVPHPAFTAWHADPAPLIIRRGVDRIEWTCAPADPYLLMAERFTEAALAGSPAPYPLAESRSTARIVEMIAAAAAHSE